MFSHVMLGANSIEESKKFYDSTLGALGYSSGKIDAKGRCFYLTETGAFAISRPIDGKPACKGNGSTIGFTANSSKEVDEWHAAGLANGGVNGGDPPGEREGTISKMYLAYLLDPAGNKICAIYRM